MMSAAWVQGSANSVAAGILIYLAIVDLIAEELAKKEVRSNVALQLKMYLMIAVGAVIMSVLAIFE
jgi:solute carrier family 39 (zinc transporter), member 1/2/3